jgi:type I restriction enzyme R subunit
MPAESEIEQWVLDALAESGLEFLQPDKLDPDHSKDFRDSYGDVILEPVLYSALTSINPGYNSTIVQQAVQEVLRVARSGELIHSNQNFQKYLLEGVEIPFSEKGEQKTARVLLVDTANKKNCWQVTHQLTIMENGNHKRPDVLVFLNGMPVIVIELKKADDGNATVGKAYHQLQTYHGTIPSLFTYNCMEIISDGLEAKVGTITSDISRFMSWKTADGKIKASHLVSEMAVMLEGMLNPATLLDLIINFTVFEKYTYEDSRTGTIRSGVYKKLAAYHQYYAVKKAVTSTKLASGQDGSGKGGVVWHTQGSGKSLSMVFYTGLLVQELSNPTIVVITDRNDLDGQLFDTFGNCIQLLRQTPKQIDSREDLVKELHNRLSGGIFFSTIQKFFPEDGSAEFPQLSDRRNIIVIADEAHRTQYGFEAKTRYIRDAAGKETGVDITYGFAKYMHDALPNATFIGFTGTPVETTDKNTKSVFGEYVDIYDIERAVLDKATVPIYYENRFIKLKLDDLLKDKLEAELTKAAEGLPEYQIKSTIERVTRMEALVGHPDRLRLIARDITEHFEARQETFTGKALVVAMTRKIAVDLYNQFIAFRPDWHSDKHEEGKIKVIMTGSSSDEGFMQPHIRSKEKRDLLARRLKDPQDPLQIVIVVDMWLTGFDAPVLHTLYLDKDMAGHNLMQAIARVNRVFKDKPGGLLVDYVPITANLKAALKMYTENQGKGDVTLDIKEAVALMMTKLEILQQMLHGFSYQHYHDANVPSKLNILLEAEEHVLQQENGKERYLRELSSLSKAYALAKVEPEAVQIREDVAFLQAVGGRLSKYDREITEQGKKDFEKTVKTLAESAIATDGIIDILEQAHLERPDVSIFSEQFMDEIRKMKQRNVAIELLKKLLADQIKIRFKKNMVATVNFRDKLEAAIKRYNNKLISVEDMIKLLLELSKEVDEETRKGKDLGLSPAEKAFYDALLVNKSARELMGDEKLLIIARELVKKVKNSTTLDWLVRQSARDRVKLEVKRVLRMHKYPPDDEVRATDTVLEQAELLAEELAA